MSRVVVSPDILVDRQQFMQERSTWYFVDLLNAQLKTGIVNPDGTVNIIIQYNIKEHTVNQIAGFYTDAGWERVDTEWTGPVESIYGSTTFTFVPPAALTTSVIQYVHDHLASGTTNNLITQDMNFTGFLFQDITIGSTPTEVQLDTIESFEGITHENKYFQFKRCADLLLLVDLNLKVAGPVERFWVWLEKQAEGSSDWEVINGAAKYIEYTGLTEGNESFTMAVSAEKGDKVRVRYSTEVGDLVIKSDQRYFGSTFVKVPSISLKVIQMN